jgi:hypothetical protein
LLEAMQRFVEEKYGVRMIGVNVVLLDVNLEVALTVGEGVFAVDLDDAKIVSRVDKNLSFDVPDPPMLV